MGRCTNSPMPANSQIESYSSAISAGVMPMARQPSRMFWSPDIAPIIAADTPSRDAWPRVHTTPRDGAMSPAMARSSVDLPDPFGSDQSDRFAAVGGRS